jgi:hypothetical protein
MYEYFLVPLFIQVNATHGTVQGVAPNPFVVPAKLSASVEVEFEKTPVAFLIPFNANFTAQI